ncbi:MAG: Arc family DNA-binding protein [Methylacidiphilales bacterium]|nr:Arc family DNA-binding protein [Candidatus Methylacidiphilales bacterium]
MAEERKPVANIAPFGLRMQPDLKARIEQAARENNRSLNSEIVSRLETSFQASSPEKFEVVNSDGSKTVISRGLVEAIASSLSRAIEKPPGS